MIKVDGLTFRFSKMEQPLFENLSLAVAPGARIALTGPSGIGKTTFIQILSGLLPFEAGRVLVAETAIDPADDRGSSDFRNRRLGVIFQNYNLLNDLTVEENLQLRLAIAKRPFDKDAMYAVLESVGMADFAQRSVGRLSGGQQQRVAAARALITGPDVVLADEPTGNLDDESAGMIIDLLARPEPGRTVIAATHDPRVSDRFERKISLASLCEGGV